TGTYRPRAPTPREALGKPEAPAIAVTVDGQRVSVCRAGACRELAVPELPADSERASAAVDDAGTLLAVIVDQGDTDGDARPPRSGHAVVYDVATGRRLRKLDLGDAYASLDFVGDALLVTHTPCAGPCSSSVLVDPRSGRRLAAVGGATAFNTSELTPARVAGTVYAFNDWDSRAIVYQDVKTGRVVQRFDRPEGGCGGDDSVGECSTRMIHAGGGIALLDGGRATGDLTLLDARGKVVARHRLPVCQP
ncbi:MAG TPA: hypothetical protein VN253_08155, partial [Kofleriaceae bacterium]|nr:hypothetical protein [Kofleriaceae bacterium]